MASPPLRWEWVREWWRIYGPVYGDRGRGLRLITVRRGTELIGVLPLYQSFTGCPWGSRQLRFTSTGEADFEKTCAEYLDLLHAPGEEHACTAAICRLLLDWPELRWDLLRLEDVPEQSPLLALVTRIRHVRHWICRTERDNSYTANLVGGFEAYLKRLSAATRKEARRVMRDAERAGMKLEIAEHPRDVETFFEELVQLHRRRWEDSGQTGCFAPRHKEFHLSLAKRLAPAGKETIARLSLGDRPLAILNGYRVGDKFDIYHQGVSREPGQLRSPGTAATLLLMARLAEAGVTVVDQLRGKNSLKARYFKEEKCLVRLSVYRPTPRTLVTTAAKTARRATAKAAEAHQAIVAPSTTPDGHRSGVLPSGS